MTLKLPLLLACALLASCAHQQTVTDSVDLEVADIVSRDRNQLAGIRAARASAAVVLKSEYLDRQTLDAMLADVRAHHVTEREAREI
jgi:hypothetical protein